MAGIRQDILDLSDDYDSLAEDGEMHLISSHTSGVGNVEGKDLIKNYTLRMARKGVPARAIYDALMILPKNNRCPYCNFGSIESLDHILPKAVYPEFSVKPMNLVGCCDRCNKKKDDAFPTCSDDGFLHPYFEHVNHVTWLVADIERTTPAAATFRVGAPNLDSDLLARVEKQFAHLELDRVYSDAAAEEIADIEDALIEVFDAGGEAAVSAHLSTQCRSRRRANLNSWRAALYDALAQSDWYCRGGFRTE
ncbi:HNH endonuclease [Nisaea sediminum]|uniref:HNH endonuclease n=1 Tax=Nisaea sediminum TaxID=2775867 RepID=UPI0018686BF0|nr:hypothetical protein [Nisaea sediminum]